MSVLLHHPTPAHAAPQIFEPSEAFKAQLRRRIDDNLDQLLLDAKRSYDDKLLALSSATPRRRPAAPQQQQRQGQQQPPLSPSPLDAADEDRGANDLLYRRKLYFDYLQSVQELKAFARDEYNHAIERERQEMEWCLEAEASVAQAHQDQGLRMVALEEGRYDDEEEQQQRGRMQEEERFRVDETLKEEQFEMLEAFHEEMKRAEAKARAIEQPSSDDEDGYYHASDDSSEEEGEEEYENVAPVAGPSGYYRRETLVELSEIEEESEQEDEEFSEPGTPIVQPLDAQLKAHAEELSRLLSATPSPPPSPCLTGSSLPASPFSLLSQAHLVDGPSPISSPSPPDTPPSLSASASASDYEQDTDTAPSSVASSIIFDPKAQDGVVAISSASGNGMIFTPQRSVIDEEIRVRQERHFKQQEEFHRKAEEIRRKKVEDKKMSRMNEMLVSLVKDTGAEKEKEKEKAAGGSSTPLIGNQALVVAGKGKTVTPFNSPRATTTVARRAAVPTPAPRYASAPSTPSKYRTATPSQALVKPAAPATPKPSSSALFSSSRQPASGVPRTFVNPTGFSISPEDMLRIFVLHDQQWARLSSSQPSSSMTVLKWSDFPWPILSFSPPKSLGELSKDGVAAYLYSSFEASSLGDDDFNGLGDPSRSAAHRTPQNKQRERQKLEAMVQRWSGYGFERMLFRVGVSGGERERVRQGASMVTGWLRDMEDVLGGGGFEGW